MNIYDQFFKSMNPDEWESFAADFLSSRGYRIYTFPSKGIDGGKDLLVEINGRIYLVSCKHYIVSGNSVGLGDEISIMDRIFQHEATGFIGFYSTIITSGLADRTKALSQRNRNIDFVLYDKSIISDHLPHISSYILQKYGLPNNIKFILNVPENEYSPLPCLSCGVDILSPELINYSMAAIYLNNDEKLEYVYGCKKCCSNIDNIGWIEVYQALHQEQLNIWIKYVNDELQSFLTSDHFYKHRSEFEGAIQQRVYPSNWGQWLG